MYLHNLFNFILFELCLYKLKEFNLYTPPFYKYLTHIFNDLRYVTIHKKVISHYKISFYIRNKISKKLK